MHLNNSNRCLVEGRFGRFESGQNARDLSKHPSLVHLVTQNCHSERAEVLAKWTASLMDPFPVPLFKRNFKRRIGGWLFDCAITGFVACEKTDQIERIFAAEA